MLGDGRLVDLDFIGYASRLPETWEVLGKLRGIDPSPVLEEDVGSECVHTIQMKGPSRVRKLRPQEIVLYHLTSVHLTVVGM